MAAPPLSIQSQGAHFCGKIKFGLAAVRSSSHQRTGPQKLSDHFIGGNIDPKEGKETLHWAIAHVLRVSFQLPPPQAELVPTSPSHSTHPLSPKL